MKYKKLSIVCLVTIISIILLSLLNITPSNIKGVVTLEKSQRKVYDKDYGYESSMEGKSEHKYATRINDGEQVFMDFMKSKGYQLYNTQGNLYKFTGPSEILLKKTSFLNKYYIWEN